MTFPLLPKSVSEVTRATGGDLQAAAFSRLSAGLSLSASFRLLASLALGRLSTRTAPDGGVERFGYSARGLVAYTNQLDKVTYYAYDEALRKTFETNANAEVIRYTNNAAGDLVALVDGKNQVTKWKYDECGRVTNKLDQAGRDFGRGPGARC